MNLITTPWLPIVKENGVKETISLGELFQQPRDIRDLAVNPPHRIALMRFLLCIVQAALDGPADEKEWSECKDDIPDEKTIINLLTLQNFSTGGKVGQAFSPHPWG